MAANFPNYKKPKDNDITVTVSSYDRLEPLKFERKPILKGQPKYKIKIWKTKYADAIFSKWVRQRDGKCRRCLRTDRPLDNSHYWKRGDSGTRFDEKNCIALCRDCHTIWERQKNNEYKQFMVDWLGPEEYEALERRARTFKSRTQAVIDFMSVYKN